MNQETILKKIEENKLESITESELIWILKSDNIRKILIKKLETTNYFPEIWDNFQTKEIQNLLNNKKDFQDIINYCYFCKEEKDNLELYYKDLINMYKSVEDYYPHLPKTIEKLKKDQQKYFENMKESIIKDSLSNPFAIENIHQIQFIIDNNIEKIYQKIDINYLIEANINKEIFEKVIDKIKENYELLSSFISNKKTLMYIIDNNINIPTLFFIHDTKMKFTKEEIPKVIEYSKKNKFEINNKDLIMYAVNNNIYDLKIKLDEEISFTDEEISKILTYLETSMIVSIISNKDIVKYCIKNERKEFANILSINTIEQIDYTDEELPKVIEVLKSITNRFNFEKLEKNKLLINYIIQNEMYDLINLISLEEQELNIDLLKKLMIYNDKEKKDNPYFNFLCKREPGEIAKFLELLKVRNLSNKDISSINESFQQQIYRQNKKEVVEIFNIIKEISESKDLSENQKYSYYLSYLNEFMKTDCIPEIIDKELKEKNPSIPYIEKKKLFLEEILLNVMIENNYQPYLDILHEVTNKYISQKANQYFIEHDIYSLPNIQINYDTKDNLREVKRKIFNYLNKKKSKHLLYILKDNGYKEDKIEGNNFKKARNIFLNWYDKTLAEEGNTSILPLELQFLLNDQEFTQNLKKEIIYEKRTLKLKDMLNNFTIEDLETLFNTIIIDNKKYQKLLELISKYKILEWPYIFNETIKTITDEEYENMFDFIKNFNEIYEKNNRIYKKEEIKSQEYQKIHKKLQEKYQNINLPKLEKELLIKKMALKQIDGNFKITPYQLLLDYNNLISINTAYKAMIGTEDYTFIKENPGPNAATRDNGESLHQFNLKRIEKSIEQYLTMLDITHNSIPSFITTINVSSEKEIKVTVGNRTSTRNLSLGERTGSCMRIGGVGEKLYEFCNSDPRGIHIVFEDPKTNDFISRISGYRNGNTLFLNQLRESTSEEYTDKDLIEACKISSEMILQLSNNQEKELPIENIIADSGYALINEERIQAPFSKLDVQLPGYSDVGNSSIVILATKNKNNTLTPLKLNPYIKPIYETARIKPTIYQEPTKISKEKIKRIQSISLCNQNSNNEEYYKELKDNNEEIDFIYAIISDDWYILLTKDNKIEIINASSDKRALEEIKEAKELLNEQIKKKVEETNNQKKR